MRGLLRKIISFFNGPLSKPLLIKALLFAFFVKLLTVFFLNFLMGSSAQKIMQSRIAVSGGDTFSYIGAMDNYIEKGEFYFINPHKENVRKNEKAYTGRMPYYGMVYYGFRSFVSKSLAADLIVVVQVFLESLSIILLSLIVYKAVKTQFSFWACYIILIFNLTITNWSAYLMTESLSISFSIFFIYYYQSYLLDANRGYTNLLQSGFFVALLVLLKPYFILLYVVIGFEFLWFRRREINRQSIIDVSKRTLVVSSALIFFLLPWTIRNYRLLDKFIPLQSGVDAGYGFSRSFMACSDFIKAWGGNMIYWDYAAAGTYFLSTSDSTNSSFTFPAYAFSKNYTLSDVEKVRNKYLYLQNNYSDSLDTQVAGEFNQLTSLYKNDRPFRYYFISPLLLTKKFLLTAPSYYLTIHPSFGGYKRYQFLLLKSQSALYYFLLVSGFIGLLYLIKKDEHNFIFLAFPLLLIILFPLTLRLIEGRYLINIYPFLVVGSVAAMDYIVKKIFVKRRLTEAMV